ncbi:LacI family DNA-binding transcriptional regulator [Pseudonocardia sichuanensis]
MRRSSLKDVATRAGVSVMTVSKVVNNHAGVAPETRAKVERAVRELQYRPNLAARNLRRGRSGHIALAVPDIAIPYFAELSRKIAVAAAAHGLSVLIDQTGGQRAHEQLAISDARAQLVDGVVLFPSGLRPDDLADRRGGVPVVLLGGRADRSTDHVVIDNVGAGREATAHLLGLGRRRIAAIGPNKEYPGGLPHTRLEGYRLALRDAGLEPDPELEVVAPAYHRADGAAAMEQLITAHPDIDAVFCFTDLLAVGAIKTLHRLGRRVPEDVAVVGFDDMEEGHFHTPALTSIAPDKEQIAAGAVDLLVRRLGATEHASPRAVQAAYRLVVRGSSDPHSSDR